MSVLVLGIDPGPKATGWVLYDGERVLAGEPDADNQRLLDFSPYWHAGVEQLNRADVGEAVLACHVGIEWITSYGMAVGADVFETCWWAGRLAQHIGGLSTPVERITRRDIKLHLCGSARAKDANVRQALIDRFGGVQGKAAAVGTKRAPGPLYGTRSHMWAALAVAVTLLDQLPARRPAA